MQGRACKTIMKGGAEGVYGGRGGTPPDRHKSNFLFMNRSYCNDYSDIAL